jgi:hypothetical protein
MTSHRRTAEIIEFPIAIDLTDHRTADVMLDAARQFPDLYAAFEPDEDEGPQFDLPRAIGIACVVLSLLAVCYFAGQIARLVLR